MRLYVSEKIFSLRSKFFVKDENLNDVYEISSNVFSFAQKTTVSDMLGNKVVYIEQELFHLTPNYNIFMNDILVCKIVKKFQFFKNDYVLSNGFRVDGDFFMLDFVVYDDLNNRIGCITKKFFSFGDRYEIDIFDESKKNIILAIIVAIANDVNRAQRNNNS